MNGSSPTHDEIPLAISQSQTTTELEHSVSCADFDNSSHLATTLTTTMGLGVGVGGGGSGRGWGGGLGVKRWVGVLVTIERETYIVSAGCTRRVFITRTRHKNKTAVLNMPVIFFCCCFYYCLLLMCSSSVSVYSVCLTLSKATCLF